MAIDERVFNRAKALFDSGIERRFKTLCHEKATSQQKHAVAGMGRSSSLDESILDLRRNEIEILCSLAWGDLRQVFEKLNQPFSKNLEDDLRNAVRSMIQSVAPRFGGFFSPSILPQVLPYRSVESDIESGLVGIDAQIGIYADQKMLNPGGSEESGLGKTVMNFNSPVGAVVTGAHAQVTLQQINDHKEELLQALKGVRDAASESSDPNSDHIVELADQAQVEISKENPNPITATSLLLGLYGTIQTVAALSPATDQLAQALAFWGIL